MGHRRRPGDRSDMGCHRRYRHSRRRHRVDVVKLELSPHDLGYVLATMRSHRGEHVAEVMGRQFEFHNVHPMTATRMPIAAMATHIATIARATTVAHRRKLTASAPLVARTSPIRAM